jgi:hypothetical protein
MEVRGSKTKRTYITPIPKNLLPQGVTIGQEFNLRVQNGEVTNLQLAGQSTSNSKGKKKLIS